MMGIVFMVCCTGSSLFFMITNEGESEAELESRIR